jgi:hypothetical protein
MKNMKKYHTSYKAESSSSPFEAAFEALKCGQNTDSS